MLHKSPLGERRKNIRHIPKAAAAAAGKKTGKEVKETKTLMKDI